MNFPDIDIRGDDLDAVQRWPFLFLGLLNNPSQSFSPRADTVDSDVLALRQRTCHCNQGSMPADDQGLRFFVERLALRICSPNADGNGKGYAIATAQCGRPLVDFRRSRVINHIFREISVSRIYVSRGSPAR